MPQVEPHVNDDVDLDELDPRGRARRRAERAASPPAVRRRRRRVLKITALCASGVVLGVVALGFYIVHHLFSRVDTVSLDRLTHRPTTARPNPAGDTPLNILVLGSQTRDGQHGVRLGNATKNGTDLSDTAFLVHLSADRRWSEIVSIPRDLEVARPDCPSRFDPSVTVPGAEQDMFDAAMNYGGPACAVATVEQMTDIRVDHFVELTFNAFEQLTDAVGGVTVCVPPPGINDPNYSGLVMSAGLHTISGDVALEFIRDRHGLSLGMDTQRIQMQQMFMTSLFTKLTANGTLEDPITLYRIANAVTSNITVDPALDDISTMISIAESVGTTEKKYMQYITVPYELDPNDPNRLVPGNGFEAAWNYLRIDKPLPGSPAAAAFGTVPSPDLPTQPAGYSVHTDPTPTPSIDTESRNGNDDLCSGLPAVADYGGSP
ncbi:LCP family protein [Actinospica sp.]|uniref:LCP family protein n=1 Tax=Actinospica sp. TaxID=1872142 RepID=UPI002CD50B44|nr:LCP family protein [Actinospica sp.]HWG25631.1 LCP family protein [Actinospica sp.]